MPATTVHYRAGDEITEEIHLDEHEDMPLRRLQPQDSVAVVLQHRRDHDTSLRLSWDGEYINQTGARAVSLALPVDELPQGGRWAVWAVATVAGNDIERPDGPRNLRIEQ
jgi:hypothetical protein